MSFHITHKWAEPEAVQQAATVPATAIVHALHRSPVVQGCIALVTCHRSEVYATGPDPDKITEVVSSYFGSEAYRSLARRQGPEFQPTSRLRTLRSRKSVDHLFRVAAGLDSVILGETEVLGQVRTALRTATEARTADLSLRQLFEAAVEVGRRVRATTRLGEGRRSLGDSVWAVLAGEKFCDRVLVVGAGQAAASILDAAPDAVRQAVDVVNRTDHHARRLASRTGAGFRPFERLLEAADRAQLCILAAPLDPALVLRLASANGDRRAARRIVLDVCQPPVLRDPAPTLGFRYVDLDAVLRARASTDERRPENFGDAVRIVEQAVDAFMRKRREASTPGGRLLRHLQTEGERIARRELDAALRRLPGLGEEQRAVLEDFARSLRQKLLMNPTIALRRSLDADRPDLAEGIVELFGVEPSTDDYRGGYGT